jgi:hypothetical protein
MFTVNVKDHIKMYMFHAKVWKIFLTLNCEKYSVSFFEEAGGGR